MKTEVWPRLAGGGGWVEEEVGCWWTCPASRTDWAACPGAPVSHRSALHCDMPRGCPAGVRDCCRWFLAPTHSLEAR